MNARELEAMLVRLSSYPPSEIDQRTRPLRGALKLIPYGPRGKNAKDLEPQHAAHVLLSMVSRRAIDAADTVMRAKDLRIVPRVGSDLSTTKGLAPTLAATIARAFERDTHIKSFEVTGDGSLAWVTFENDGMSVTILFTDDQKVHKLIAGSSSLYDKAATDICGHRFVMPSGAFAEVIRAFKHSTRNLTKDREHGLRQP